ncbi:MAG: 4Fe-4S binding protein [Candidatus Omnitrophica bacterium]|nr:4Fe-4S binding protein [Candidatus Omnitrophota bacterium]
MKIIRYVMIWFLPLIVIGGLFFPYLGFLVLGMMLFFLPLSFYKGRYWCSNVCPRGSFLDIILAKISLNRPFPKVFVKQPFRWAVFFRL